jgi:hypothetical protein
MSEACANARAMDPERLVEIMASRPDFGDRLRNLLKAHESRRKLADMVSPPCFIEAARESVNECELAGPEFTHREGRSLADGPYNPDWRFRQTELYLSYQKRPTDPTVSLRSFMLEEDDQEVLGRYAFRSGLRTPKDPAYEFALHAHADREGGVGAVIKAMVLADVSVEEIARGFSLPVAMIQTFVNIFWHLTPLQGDPDWKCGLVSLPNASGDPNVAKICESVLMIAAVELGKVGVEQMLTGQVAGGEGAELIACMIERGRRETHFDRGELMFGATAIQSMFEPEANSPYADPHRLTVFLQPEFLSGCLVLFQTWRCRV